MIRRVRITDLGPHEHFNFALDPDGVTRVSGRSEAGKSTLIEATLFALWGRSSAGRFRPELIRDATEDAAVEVELEDGRVIQREVRRPRTQRRIITHEGKKTRHSSEAAFVQALGELGTDPELAALILAPMGWIELVAANARPFRDVLSRALPGGDLIETVQALARERGHEVSEEAAGQDEKSVMKARRDAKKQQAQAEGRMQAARALIDSLEESPLEAPAEADVSQARALLTLRDAWRAFDLQAEARQRDEAQLMRWQARREELGDEPAFDADEHTRARVAVEAAQRALDDARAQAAKLASTLESQRASLGALEAAGDSCPMCARAGWAEAATRVEEKRVEVSQRQSTYDAKVKEGIGLRAKVEATQATLDEAAQQRQIWERWRAQVEALGWPPSLDEAAPAAPAEARPGAEQIGWAESIERGLQSAKGARAQREQTQSEGRRSLAEAQDERDGLEAQIAEMTALLEAVREAPSVLASRQAKGLGDLGPVTLRLGDNPAVEVLIDGRPWWLASRGRLLVADMWLRAALRRVSPWPTLPMFVDNITDVGGQPLAPIAAPVVLIETTEEAMIRVEAGAPLVTTMED